MPPIANWRLLSDQNKENWNAGNGGDLVKHTVYLATLRFLLAREPWSQGLHLRECHAGRGIYPIAAGDARRRLLSCLYSDPSKTNEILLQRIQHDILNALGCWPETIKNPRWYAGSGLINAFTLAKSKNPAHLLELYELNPQTRRILCFTLSDLQLEEKLRWSAPAPENEEDEFDGESYIERHVGEWKKQDVVLLDPFAMWRQPADQFKRDRYGAVIQGLLGRGADAPSLILFWTWGRAFPVADGDLNGTNHPVRNGYQELRAKLHNAGFRFVRVTWRWGLQFAMWIVVAEEHLAALRDEIGMHCRLLRDHLILHGCGRDLPHPIGNVAID